MDRETGRALADAARDAAERLAAVDAMLEEVDEKGLVALERDSVDYVAPGDARIVELVEGGSDWARYTARLKDGSIYQEGGVRRILFTTAAKAKKLVKDKAVALPKAPRLYTLVETYRRARNTRGEGMDPFAHLWGDEKLRAKLVSAILDRAGSEEESGRIPQTQPLEIMAGLGVDEDTLHRLSGRTSLPSSVLEGLEPLRRVETPPVLDQTIEKAIAARRKKKDFVLLTGVEAPYVAWDAPDVKTLVTEPTVDWSYGVVLAGGDVHLEGFGGARERYTISATADAIAMDRVERVLSSEDLRLLLFYRAELEKNGARTRIAERVAGDEELTGRLEERIRELAESTTPEPPLGQFHLARLQLAGIPLATIRRLTRDLSIDEEALSAAAVAAAGEGGPGAEVERGLEELVDARTAAGGVWLSEDVVGYVERDGDDVERLLDGAPDWATHAALLSDGAVHIEGGLRRRRLVAAADVDQLLVAAADRVIESEDLFLLLNTAFRMARQAMQPTVSGVFARDEELRERLLVRIFEVAKEPEWAGRIVRTMHIDLLKALGAPTQLIAHVSPRSFGAEAAGGAAKEDGDSGEAAGPSVPPAEALDAEIDDKLADGWVELREDAVPYLALDDDAVERAIERLLPWTRHVLWLRNGEIHLEGGTRRIRVCEPGRAQQLLEEGAEALIESEDLFELLDTAARALAGTPYPSVYRTIAEQPALQDGLEEKILSVAALSAWDGRVARRAHRELLTKAGVGEERLAALAGETWHDPAALEARRQAALAAKTTSEDEARQFEELLARKLEDGYVILGPDVVGYLPSDDERIETLLSFVPDWCTHGALLDDGAVHLEGGVERQRYVAADIAERALAGAADALLEGEDLYPLLDLVLEIHAGRPAPSVAAHVAAAPKLDDALRKRALELAQEERYTGHVGKAAHIDALELLEADTELLARLRP